MNGVKTELMKCSDQYFKMVFVINNNNNKEEESKETLPNYPQLYSVTNSQATLKKAIPSSFSVFSNTTTTMTGQKTCFKTEKICRTCLQSSRTTSSSLLRKTKRRVIKHLR